MKKKSKNADPNYSRQGTRAKGKTYTTRHLDGVGYRTHHGVIIEEKKT